jgi:hypothetical protein
MKHFLGTDGVLRKSCPMCEGHGEILITETENGGVTILTYSEFNKICAQIKREEKRRPKGKSTTS